MTKATKGGTAYRNLRNFLVTRSCNCGTRTVSTSRQLKDAYEYERERVISNRMTQQLQRVPKSRKRRFIKYSRNARIQLKAERKQILKESFMILSKPLPSVLKERLSSCKVSSEGTYNNDQQASRVNSKVFAPSIGIPPQSGRFANLCGHFKQQFGYVRSRSRLLIEALTVNARLSRSRRVHHVPQHPVAKPAMACNTHKEGPLHSSRRHEEKVNRRSFSLVGARSVNAAQSSGLQNNHASGTSSIRLYFRNSSQSFSESGDPRRLHSSGSSEGSQSSSAVYKQRYRYKIFGKSWASWLKSWRSKYYRREHYFGKISLSLLRLWHR